jgi:hypothetical protein
MAYSDFTLNSAAEILGVEVIDRSFLPAIEPVPFNKVLLHYLKRGQALAVGAGSEKARSEFIIAPILLELDEILQGHISIFSGQELTVDKALGLNGICDFIISRSPVKVKLSSPVVAIVEAKKGVMQDSWGQPATQDSEEASEQSVAVCIAEMVAAQRFNRHRQEPDTPIYGIVTTGNLWQFLVLEDRQVSIDNQEYPLEPVERILGILHWMLKNPGFDSAQPSAIHEG